MARGHNHCSEVSVTQWSVEAKFYPHLTHSLSTSHTLYVAAPVLEFEMANPRQSAPIRTYSAPSVSYRRMFSNREVRRWSSCKMSCPGIAPRICGIQNVDEVAVDEVVDKTRLSCRPHDYSDGSHDLVTNRAIWCDGTLDLTTKRKIW